MHECMKYNKVVKKNKEEKKEKNSISSRRKSYRGLLYQKKRLFLETINFGNNSYELLIN